MIKRFIAGLVICCLPTNGIYAQKLYTQETMPCDGKVYAIRPTHKIMKARYLRGMPFMVEKTISDSHYLGLYADLTHWNTGKRRFIVFCLEQEPDEGSSQIGNRIVSFSDAYAVRKALNDMLRTGRNWRNAGIAEEDKEITFPAVDGFHFKMYRYRNRASVMWGVFNTQKNVAFLSDSLEKLSSLSAYYNIFYDWLDES